jgi:Uncharacterised protein family (UPF0236)
MHEITACVRSATGFEQLEHDVFAVVCRAGCESLSAALSEFDASLDVPRRWRSRGLRDRVLATRLGPLHIRRRLFFDEQGHNRYPLDERLGLTSGARVSPALERALVSLSSSVSFREAAAIVSDLTGSDISHATAHSLVRRAGERIAAEQRQAASDLHDLGLDPGGTRGADPLLVEADGTVVAWQGERTRKGEVRLAVFTGGRVGGRTVSYASVEGASAFWRAASSQCAGAFDITSVRACVLSGDGANWIRGGLDVLPNARFLLDPFHIQLALRDATGSHPVASRLSAVLYAEGLPVVEQALEDLASREPERAEGIERVLGYLRANSDGLWRSTPSLGMIEGHIDKTLANRMKKRGRRWSRRGADAMARVIAAQRSGRQLPIGAWSAPAPTAGSKPDAPVVSRPCGGPTPARIPQGGIVSHATGRGFTKKLRDIARGGRADWDL